MSKHTQVWQQLENDPSIPLHIRTLCVKYRMKSEKDAEYFKKLSEEERNETREVYNYWKEQHARTS